LISVGGSQRPFFGVEVECGAFFLLVFVVLFVFEVVVC
jgi:hypothetical protein